MHGVVAHLGVEHVDETDGATAHHQRQRDHAAEAPAPVRLSLLLAQVRRVEVADDHRLVGGEGGDGGLVYGELSLRPHLVGVPAVAVHAGETAEHAAVHLPDVAVLGGEDGAQPVRDGPGELLERAGLVEAVAELHQLPQRRVAASQPREQVRGTQSVGDGPPGLGQEPAHVVEVALVHVVDVDEADHLVGAHQRDREHALEVELREVLALVVGQALVVERADHQDLPAFQRLPGGRVVVEPQEPPAHALVHAARVDAGEAAQVPFLRPPDVAVGAADGRTQARRRALGDVHRRLGRGEVRAQLDELLAESGDLPGFFEQRSAVEHAGDELAHAGEELEVRAPVALRVVIHVDQADELAAGHQRHGQRAGESVAAHQFPLVHAETPVAQVADHERGVVEEGALQGRIPGGVEDLVAHAGVRAFPGKADGEADHPSARPPDVHAVGVGGGEQPLREAQDEALEVVGLRHLPGEVDQLAHGLVAVRELSHGALDGRGFGADPRQAPEHFRVAREVAVTGVAQLDGSDELAAQHHRPPGERVAAAPLHGLSRAAREPAVGRAHAGDGGGRGVALHGHPLARGPRGSLASRHRVLLAGLHGHRELQELAVAEVHVTARRARQVAQRTRRSRRHFVRIVGEQ